ncbi:MAG: gluconeogenesis factor YvcK family protein [Terriglobales bacterium]
MNSSGSHPATSPGSPTAARSPRDAMRVVAIGGGSGLSILLRGLKHLVHKPGEERGPGIRDLTAVVTVTDDGGSSGRLRRDFGILPPGDIRNCMVALSEDEALMARLFQYRFPEGSVFSGHSFGNIFVTALTSVTGDFAEAVKLSSGILATRGHIFPSTLSDVQLEAVMDDGSTVQGETRISASSRRIVQLRLAPAQAEPLPQTLAAIAQADLITVGPGSLFTSLIPNLLVEGIPEALASSRATKVYVCNLMTQANESLSMTASDHIRAIHAHASRPIFDIALLNATPASPEMRARYALEGAAQVVSDVQEVEEMGVRAISADLLEPDGVARHNPERLAEQLLARVNERDTAGN